MAGLSGDCFPPGGGLLGVEEAAALVAARAVPLAGEERVPLRAARGRVLARDVIAGVNLPPFANSAVDGYAFAHAELRHDGAWLRLAGRVAAGEPAPALGRGQAVQVMTGAPLPAGADTVVMQETAEVTGGTLRLPPGLPRGTHARQAGEDLARGGLALPKGRRLGPAEIGLAAALGLAGLPVAPRPRVGVFSTGSELVSPGRTRGGAQIFDSNRFTLLALLDALPVEAIDLGILRDRPDTLAGALAGAAASHDLLLTSGGVSVGEADHTRAAIAAAGSLVFWQLAIKPGKPAALGVVGGTPVLGLPGNPVAAVVAFLHLARPLILRLAGATPTPLPRFPAAAGFAHRKKPGRREYLRVTLAPGGAAPLARKAGPDGAAMLASLARAEGFVELGEAVEAVEPGDTVPVLPFAGLL